MKQLSSSLFLLKFQIFGNISVYIWGTPYTYVKGNLTNFAYLIDADWKIVTQSKKSKDPGCKLSNT